ncbi:unnamed protein product [Bathycoccus prasinos]
MGAGKSKLALERVLVARCVEDFEHQRLEHQHPFLRKDGTENTVLFAKSQSSGKGAFFAWNMEAQSKRPIKPAFLSSSSSILGGSEEDIFSVAPYAAADIRNERRARRPKGFQHHHQKQQHNGNDTTGGEKKEEETENPEDESEKKSTNATRKQLGSLDEKSVVLSVAGEAGPNVKIRAQFIGNETNGMRDAQVVANVIPSSFFVGRNLKDRLEVFAERSRLVIVGIDEEDEYEDGNDIKRERRIKKKGDAIRNAVNILDDEMVAGVKFMPPPPPKREEEEEEKQKANTLNNKEKRERLKTYATVRVTPTKSSVQATVSNGYAPVHSLISRVCSLSSTMVTPPSFDEQLVLHSNDVLENNAGKIRFAQRLSIDSNGNSAKSIRASFTHTTSSVAEDTSPPDPEETPEEILSSKRKKTRTHTTATVNLREKKSRGRIKPGEIVESTSSNDLKNTERLKDSAFRPKLNVAKQFFLARTNDDDVNDHHHHQQQTYKLSCTVTSRLVEAELARKFKLTDSIEGEIVVAAKLLASRHYAYGFWNANHHHHHNHAQVTTRDAMVGVYFGSCKDIL